MPEQRKPPQPEQDPHDESSTDPTLDDEGSRDPALDETKPRLKPSFAPSLAGRPTMQWGDLNQRKILFLANAEQHALEAKRLRRESEELARSMESPGQMLRRWNIRETVLERLGAERDSAEDEELRTLHDVLLVRRAEYERDREQRQRLMAQANHHARSAERWRALADHLS